MESKLLYDMFNLCVLTKEEIISYIEQKEDKYFEILIITTFYILKIKMKNYL